jgi:two-component system, sensor histidine kinase PdtaS
MAKYKSYISLITGWYRLCCFICLCLLISKYANAQYYTGPRPSLLFKEYHTSKPDSLSVQTLLQLSSFYVTRQGESKSNLDSALFFAKEAVELSKKKYYLNAKDEAEFLRGMVYMKSHLPEKFGQLLHQLNVANQIRLMLEMIRYNTVILGMKRNEIDSLMALANRSLYLSDSIGSPELIAQSYLQLSNINYQKNDFLKAKEFFLIALNKARKASNADVEAAIFSQASGNVMVDESILEELLNSGKRLMAIMPGLKGNETTVKIQYLIVMGYDQLSYYYTYKGKLDEALFYSLEMVKMLEKSGNAVLIELPYQTIGKIYLDLGKLELSIEYLKKAGSIVSSKYESLDASALKNITKAYIGLSMPQDALAFLMENAKQGRYDDVNSRRLIAESIGNCYFEMKQYNKAESFYLESLQYGKKSSYMSKLISYVPLSKLYVVTKQYGKAKPYLYELISDSNNSTVPIFVQRDVHFMLFKVDSSAAHFEASIRHLQQYKILNDSIFNEKRNGQLEELNLQYETDKKNKDIKLKEQNIELLTRQAQLQEADLKSTRFSRNVFIGGIIVLFVMLGMMYNRYRFKQKTNRLLQLQQEDIKGNNLQLQHLNDEQQKLLTEKEWLVKEIHHRIKNNLQMIISLLNAQSEFLDHPSALNAVKESRERMQAIALIHQKLYQPDQGTVINMDCYIRELVDYLYSSFADAERIHFNLEVEPIQLDVSQSVPVGLILNEAITNVFKYAFQKDEKGNVNIELHHINETDILLKIADNGQGFSKAFDIAESNSLGIQLIKLFAEQLEGNLQFNSSKGVEISLIFRQQYSANKSSSYKSN